MQKKNMPRGARKLHQNLCKKHTDISKQKKEIWKKDAKCKKKMPKEAPEIAPIGPKMMTCQEKNHAKKGTKNCATSLAKEHHIIKGEPKMPIVELSQTYSLESN